jgi:hypothetical protein
MRLIMRTYDVHRSWHHIIVNRESVAVRREIIDSKGLAPNLWKIFEAIRMTLGNRWVRSFVCLVTRWRSRKYDLHDVMLGFR